MHGDKINSYTKCDDALANIVRVLPSPLPPTWAKVLIYILFSRLDKTLAGESPMNADKRQCVAATDAKDAKEQERRAIYIALLSPLGRW